MKPEPDTLNALRRTSAVTLSDMEVFIFPELIYSLVLANLMSPRLWRWRDDAWFEGLDGMKPYRRITRLKQYIMDRYVFNLDLDTWGLTTKERELARFSGVIDADTLAQSNALFGYEGDAYYFDIDIRTHFGLDKYAGNVIPYWKTETVEAMDAFAHKPDYRTGAGECVSLATLYAAALFGVARVPLDDIFLMATPLHSQNFIDLDDGILTNNRRLVTKTMWFNGTALSAQARRALENERVTLVAHHSGVLHQIYPEATIDPGACSRFADRLRAYLATDLTHEILGNFLRASRDLQKCFQLRWPLHGVDHYVPVERLFAYEHGSPYRVTDNTREKLLDDVDMEEFVRARMPSRIVLNDLEAFVRDNAIDIRRPADRERLKQRFSSDCLNADIAIECLFRFCLTEPRLPDLNAKRYLSGGDPLDLHADMSREALIERLDKVRATNRMAELAFYAYRDLTRTEPEPFLAAAMQRNPVCVEGAEAVDTDVLPDRVRAFTEASIYDGPGRLAQPDEVWNYGRGDGLEKAVLLAALLRARRPGADLRIDIEGDTCVLRADGAAHAFPTAKQLPGQSWPMPAGPDSPPAG
ncbi:MAG: hypothetical protein JXB13_12960 [Phycisphaerae bacterium]|nr:hypothetical protein [Phycisphaerae bacterium]